MINCPPLHLISGQETHQHEQERRVFFILNMMLASKLYCTFLFSHASSGSWMVAGSLTSARHVWIDASMVQCTNGVNKENRALEHEVLGSGRDREGVKIHSWVTP